MRLGLFAVFAFTFVLAAQVIEFESGGLKYQTLTRNGLTVMFAQLPSHVREYSILQVAISNGSKTPCVVKPEDFIYYKAGGEIVHAVPAGVVVTNLVEKASRHDVIKLVVAYEGGIYGNSKLRSTNGYEVRRQNALAEVGSPKIKAAAAASAIAFVNTRLLPGESTDGAVFYSNSGKPLGPGKLLVKTSGGTFEFPMVSSN